MVTAINFKGTLKKRLLRQIISLRDRSQIMLATGGGGGFWKMLTITDKGGRGQRKQLTAAPVEQGRKVVGVS